MLRRRRLLAAGVVGAALLAPGAAQAHDFVVTQSTDPAPDDVCDTNCTLRDAIDLSNTNGEDDTITFASTVTAAAAAKDADGTSKTTKATITLKRKR